MYINTTRESVIHRRYIKDIVYGGKDMLCQNLLHLAQNKCIGKLNECFPAVNSTVSIISSPNSICNERSVWPTEPSNLFSDLSEAVIKISPSMCNVIKPWKIQ